MRIGLDDGRSRGQGLGIFRGLIAGGLSMNDKRGLIGKFHVTRVDGSDKPGGKHHGCRYFVLDLDHDKHALAALAAYQESCEKERPNLARDLAIEITRMGFLFSGESE